MNKLLRTPSTLLLTGLFAVMAVSPALAHHPMGGAVPSTFGEGLFSGLGHPVIGLDHLAFVVAVGVASAFLARSLLMPLFFVAATAVGVVVHLGAFDLPAAEVVIALSVLAAGTLLITRTSLPVAAWACLFAFAGLFHGYAYGESIIGAEAAPLGAYFLGFSVIQYAIAAGACLAVRQAIAAGRIERAQIAGGVVAGVGVVFVAEALLPF